MLKRIVETVLEIENAVEIFLDNEDIRDALGKNISSQTWDFISLFSKKIPDGPFNLF